MRSAFGIGMVALLAGCGDDPTTPAAPPAPPAVDSPAAVVDALADAYQWRDIARLDRLLAQEPGAEYLFHLVEPLPSGRTEWDAVSELYIHQRMFTPDDVPPGQPPVPVQLQLESITMGAVATTPFAEIANPSGLDPERWRTFEAVYRTQAHFNTQSETDYQVDIPAVFQVIEDLAKQSGEEGRFLLYSWRDVQTASPGMETSVEPKTWGRMKLVYAAGNAPSTPAALAEELRSAYAARDFDRYAALFPPEPESAQFRFVLADPFPGPADWDLAEELRIHRRMFRPDEVQPGEPPVPADLWLTSITALLIPVNPFAEFAVPAGLDSLRWRTWEADYDASILFNTQSEVDFMLHGWQHFVVADLRHRLEGVPGKMSLYRWTDLGRDLPAVLGADAPSAASATWTDLKQLYR